MTEDKSKRKAWNSSLNVGKGWGKRKFKGFDRTKKQKRMRPIAKKKWVRYERDRGWVLCVYRDWLITQNWTDTELMPCPKCGRSFSLSQFVLEHIKHREKFPELIWNPHNWQPLCKSCNEKKYHDDHGEVLERRDVDYRGDSLKLYMELKAQSDWDEMGLGSFYPDEKSGAWRKIVSGQKHRFVAI